MKKRIFVVCSGFLFAAAVFTSLTSNAVSASLHDDDDAQIRHLKKVLWKKAYREQDTELLKRILDDKFQVIYDDGSWSDKKKELEYISKNRPGYDSFEYTIKRLDIFDNGTAIVSGEGHVQGKNAKGKYEYRYQSSNVLIKTNGEWKAVSSHVSGIKRTEFPAEQ